MNDVVREFLLETHENLAQLDLDLVTLEKDPTERDTLARVFRTLHTVKGTAGFMGLAKLQAVSHAAENLLSRLRAGELFFNAMIASTLLEAVDAIKRMLVAVEKTEQDGDGDYSELITALGELRAADTGEVPPLPETPPATMSVPALPGQSSSQFFDKPPAGSSSQFFDKPITGSSSQLIDKAPAPSPKPAANPKPAASPKPAAAGPKMPDSGTIYIPAKRAPHTDPALSTPLPAAKAPAAPITITSPIRLAPQLPAAPPPSAPGAAPEGPPAEAPEPRASAVSDSSIRVDVGLIDKLMTLVGELVLARNQIVQFSGSQDNPTLLGPVHRLNTLTTELQAGVMKTRMQPIGNVWSKFRRQVRDLAVACERQVRLDMEGGETEVDKTIIEAIRDPLTHTIRNAIVHGIEPPEERRAAGKHPEGRLVLHAFHEGGKVIIQITDDGCGIDPQRVRAKAIKTKLLTEEEAEQMSDPELVSLIFLPGFTTKDKVDNFSGRGVGMDVVRTNIEKIGGTVEIESQVGKGTSVKLKIPLTLAIIPALTITSGGARYAIPQVNLLELVSLDAELARLGIEYIHEAPVYRLRGQLLPLVYLNRQLGVPDPPDAETVNIVVLQADERQFGLVVDAIHDTQEIVVKPLQKHLKAIHAFSGATIMGDGRVALILDVMGLAQRAKVLSDMRVRTISETPPAPEPVRERRFVLLFATADGARMAMPLSSVARLEEFPRKTLEKNGARYVVQYRGDIMPLIDIARVLRPKRNGRDDSRRGSNGTLKHAEASEIVQVVVHSAGEKRVGLVVGQILDVVEDTFTSRTASNRPNVLFTAVIQERVTDFLDVDGLVRAALPDLFTGRGEMRGRKGES
jgi:two-component system chemotaxis sensor kinase CheA